MFLAQSINEHVFTTDVEPALRPADLVKDRGLPLVLSKLKENSFGAYVYVDNLGVISRHIFHRWAQHVLANIVDLQKARGRVTFKLRSRAHFIGCKFPYGSVARFGFVGHSRTGLW